MRERCRRRSQERTTQQIPEVSFNRRLREDDEALDVVSLLDSAVYETDESEYVRG